MTGFWPAIWSSPGRATATGATLSTLIASVLYAFNWHTFYDTRTLEARQGAARIATDIATLTNATKGSDAERFRATLQEYIDNRHARVVVNWTPRQAEDPSEWVLSNNASVDESRTQLDEHFAVDANIPGALSVTVREGIRPSLTTALVRAWTFSILDYLDSPADWWSRALYNRSERNAARAR